MSEQSAGDGDVDYRSAPSPFDSFDRSERRVAWAVLRALATSAWCAAGVYFTAWVLISGADDVFNPRRLVTTVAVLVVAATLEIHATTIRPARDDR